MLTVINNIYKMIKGLHAPKRVTPLLLFLVLLSLFSYAIAGPISNTRLYNSTNRIRVNNGISTLVLDSDISQYALQHSRTMARKGSLFHTSNLSSILVNKTWSIAGENIGTGPSIQSIQRAFMQSPSHRTNILMTNYKYTGMGVYQDSNGQYWVTIIFWG